MCIIASLVSALIVILWSTGSLARVFQLRPASFCLGLPPFVSITKVNFAFLFFVLEY